MLLCYHVAVCKRGAHRPVRHFRLSVSTSRVSSQPEATDKAHPRTRTTVTSRQGPARLSALCQHPPPLLPEPVGTQDECTRSCSRPHRTARANKDWSRGKAGREATGKLTVTAWLLLPTRISGSRTGSLALARCATRHRPPPSSRSSRRAPRRAHRTPLVRTCPSQINRNKVQ